MARQAYEVRMREYEEKEEVNTKRKVSRTSKNLAGTGYISIHEPTQDLSSSSFVFELPALEQISRNTPVFRDGNERNHNESGGMDKKLLGHPFASSTSDLAHEHDMFEGILWTAPVH